MKLSPRVPGWGCLPVCVRKAAQVLEVSSHTCDLLIWRAAENLASLLSGSFASPCLEGPRSLMHPTLPPVETTVGQKIASIDLGAPRVEANREAGRAGVSVYLSIYWRGRFQDDSRASLAMTVQTTSTRGHCVLSET